MSGNKDKLMLNFNCPGNDPFETKNNFLNNNPVSQSCKFVIGVFAVISDKNYIPYTLEATG